MKPAVASLLGSMLLVAALPALPAAETVEPAERIGDFYLLPDSRLDQVYLRDGVDFSDYDKVMIDTVALWYAQGGSFRPPYVDVARMELYFRTALVKALMEGYQIVDEPGPGVLQIHAELIDLKTTPATEEGLSQLRRYRFPTAPGHVTLVGQFHDAESGMVIARAADMDKAEGDPTLAEPVENWEQIEQAFARWAVVVRAFLDEAHASTSAAE